METITKPKYVCSIDQGTGSTRCILFDHSGAVVAVSQTEHKQYYPKPSWVEHDPEEIWNNTSIVVTKALEQAGAEVKDIASIGLTNQRETIIVWNRNTGKSYGNALVWQVCFEKARHS